MAEQVSRRSFFKLLGGAVALAAVPTKAIANLIEIPVEFGWTWKIKEKSEFSDIVAKTLRANSSKIRDNLSQNNVLYMKLKEGQKIKLNIERIDPDEQTRRMAERAKARLPKPLPKYEETFGAKYQSKEEFFKNYPPFTKKDFDKRA